MYISVKQSEKNKQEFIKKFKGKELVQISKDKWILQQVKG